MPKPPVEEYKRVTLRLSPSMYREVQNQIGASPGLRNTNDVIRKAIHHYVLGERDRNLEEMAERIQQAPIAGETVSIRMEMPKDTYKQIVWLARHKERVLPIDLLLRYVTKGVMSIDPDEIERIDRLEKAFGKVTRKDDVKKAQEADWLGK